MNTKTHIFGHLDTLIRGYSAMSLPNDADEWSE